jgi:hypothetical protein
MIEGTLKDASLPGLLQFLATENNELYKVELTAGSNSGQIFISNGSVISATFNLLNGEDALCEFLTWREGSFCVERLALEFADTIKKNINLRLESPNSFVNQSAFLSESVVGLNTVIIPSKKFGSLEWQDALRTKPLEREDFVLMSWLKEGRTMRQACREFEFDIVKATGILYRLLLTHSIEPLRSGAQRSFAWTGSNEDELNQSSQAGSKPVPVNLATLRSAMEARLKLRRQSQLDQDETHEQKDLTKSPQPSPVANQGAAGAPAVAAVSPSLVPAIGAAGSTGNVTMAATSGGDKYDAASNGSNKLVSEAPLVANNTIDCAPEPVAAAVNYDLPEGTVGFLSKKTDVMPIITIDIERLLQAVFTTTQFGKIALTNAALDQHLRQSLLDVEAGKSLLVVLSSVNRSPASILSTYRFCLARGYLLSADPVIPLTADLLLGRMELDQYLLQRRRINGDELRDLIEIEKQKGIKLTELLLRHGHVTVGDLERLTIEQKRFALS